MELLATLGLLGFAAYRVTQLIVHDSILDGFRLRLDGWHANGIRPGRTNRARTFVRDLLSCVYCAGFHVSWLTVLVYLLTTDGTPAPWDGFRSFLTFGILSFAVAGVQALLNRWDDTRHGEG